MKTKLSRILLTIAGIVLFDFLFWKETPGVNAFIFTLFILVAIFLIRKDSISHVRGLITTIGLFLAGVSVSIYGSFLSVICYFGAFLVFMGFMLEPQIRSIFYAVASTIKNYFSAPFLLLRDILERLTLRKKSITVLRFLKVIILPLIIIIVFVTIYRYANPVFNDIFIRFDRIMHQLFDWIWKYISVGHLIFLIFTLWLVSGIIYKGNNALITNFENKSTDILNRVKVPREKRLFWLGKMTGLKDEYRSGVLLLLILNITLLVVNITEAMWISRQNPNPAAHELSEHLHEGTWLLLLSMFLSILVLLFYFRKNLNFYSKNKFLVQNALVWIFLNAILALNVLARDWFYISHYGLTYLRIGVIFFLLLVTFGLISMSIKVRKRKSLYYLFRINAWSFYALVVFFSLVNWDWAIAKYNMEVMNNKSNDIVLLLNLPPRAYPVIERNLAILEAQDKIANTNKDVVGWFRQDVKRFITRQESCDWQSYTLFDRLAYWKMKSSPILKETLNDHSIMNAHE